MDKQQIADLIQALTAERDDLIAQVNQRIAFLNGKIEALVELIAPPETTGGAEAAEE